MIKQQHGLIPDRTGTSMAAGTIPDNAAKGSLVYQMEKSLKRDQTIAIICVFAEVFTGD